MPIQIKAPDGSIAQFPDGTDDATITRVMQKTYGGPKTQQSSDTLGVYKGAMHILDRGAQAAKYVANKIPVPGLNEGLGTAVDQAGQALGLQSTEGAVQSHSDYIAQQAQKGRVPSMRGEITGQILATAPLAMLPGGLATQGAAAGALASDKTDIRGIGEDAALGAAVSKGVGYAGQLAAKAAKPIVGPTVDAVRNVAKRAYDAVDNSGMIISGNAMRDLTQRVEASLAKAGAHPLQQPKAMVAFNELASQATNPKTKGNVTLQGLDIIKQIAGNARASADADERRVGKIIQDHINDFAENLTSHQTVGPVDQNAIGALSQARTAWRTLRKAEIIQRAEDKAKNSASNLTAGGGENATRTAFRHVASNPNKLAQFSPEEQQAILKVVRGGPVSNAMRLIGKMAPRGVVPLIADVALGSATGLGTATMAAGGEIARASSGIATSRAAQVASALVRSGGKMAPQAPSYASKLLSKAVTPTRIAAPVLAVTAADQTTY